MRSRRGRKVTLVRSRDSGGHPSEPAQVLNGLTLTQINSSVAREWPVCLCSSHAVATKSVGTLLLVVTKVKSSVATPSLPAYYYYYYYY